jgi:hypothetical protein
MSAGLYDTFRDIVPWRGFVPGSDEIPGLEQHGDPVDITVRDHRKMTRVGEDVIADRIIWTLPDNRPEPGDLLDGVEILRVENAIDREGNVLYWIAYVAG